MAVRPEFNLCIEASPTKLIHDIFKLLEESGSFFFIFATMDRYLILILCLVSCQFSGQESQLSYHQISPSAFAEKINSDYRIQLIDVRTPDEFASGNITEAINIDFYSKDFLKVLEQLDRDRPILVYCKSGGRSAKTCAQLKMLKFKEVYELKGGYTAWLAGE